jgi:hypothetical protein
MYAETEGGKVASGRNLLQKRQQTVVMGLPQRKSSSECRMSSAEYSGKNNA